MYRKEGTGIRYNRKYQQFAKKKCHQKINKRKIGGRQILLT